MAFFKVESLNFFFHDRFYLHHMRKFALRLEGKLAIVTNVLENKPSLPSPSPFPAGIKLDMKVTNIGC